MERERVGMRRLRQNLHAYVERVKAGETVVVTERRRPVAMLVPLPDPTSTLERLYRDGRATRPTGSLSELPPPLKVDDPDISAKIRQALEETRADTI